MKMKVLQPTKDHEALRQELLSVIRKYDKMSSAEALCVIAQLVGQVIALMDQTKCSAEELMHMVAINIENGNKAAIHQLLGTTKGNA